MMEADFQQTRKVKLTGAEAMVIGIKPDEQLS